MTREEWLEEMMRKLAPMFAAAGAPLPMPLPRVSVGFARGSRRAIGQCHDARLSADGRYQVFVGPTLDEAGAAHVLTHELVHAAVGTAAGHRGEFRRVALALGLAGRMTSTHAGPELARRLVALAAEVGPYPHAVLQVRPRGRPSGSRMLRLECGCARIVRASSLVAEGPPIQCARCNSNFLTDVARRAVAVAQKEAT